MIGAATWTKIGPEYPQGSMLSINSQCDLRHGRLAIVSIISLFLILIVFVSPVHAKDVSSSGDAEIAAELTNPIADITIIPIQMNYDRGIGEDDGWKLQTNVQPVIPVNLSDDWNLITRPVIPVIYQEDVLPGAGAQFGLGDTLLNLFFSPVRPTAGGIIWGASPVLLLPTATDSKLGAKKWGGGPLRDRTDQARGMDGGCACQSCLVVCRRRRPARCQPNQFAAVRGLHIAKCMGGVGEFRKHLRLEN